MPDCASDGQMLEHLVHSLMPPQHPLWPHAQSSTTKAAELVEDANAHLDASSQKWKRFNDSQKIKAEIRSWLAWQEQPGIQFGAAINNHVLGHDSPQAIAFLRRLKELFSLPLPSIT